MTDRFLTETISTDAASDGAPSTFAADLLAGLSQHPKNIPPKYFYDRAGSLLFDRICTLPEYYVTRVELALLDHYANQIASLIGPEVEVVEFGAGSLEKIGLLLETLDRPIAYRPIDISDAYLAQMSARLGKRRPGLAIEPLACDFTRSFALPPLAGGARRRVGFFPGSTIGNFERADARDFLRRTHAQLRCDGLLIGVDLVKDPARLHAAYNDADGITALFNKNLLVRANRELEATFALDRFAHYAPYNPIAQRIEMYLVSLGDQQARIGGEMIGFRDGEAVCTEYSYKYSIESFRHMAEQAGYLHRAVWTDPDRLFSVHYLEPD